METNIGIVKASKDGFLEVEISNPKQTIKKAVLLHPAELDEREETALIKNGTEVIILTDESNATYVLGSTSQGIKRSGKKIKIVEQDEALLKGKIVQVKGLGDEASADAFLVKAKATLIASDTFAVLSSGVDLMDVLIEMADAIISLKSVADLAFTDASADQENTELASSCSSLASSCSSCAGLAQICKDKLLKFSCAGGTCRGTTCDGITRDDVTICNGSSTCAGSTCVSDGVTCSTCDGQERECNDTDCIYTGDTVILDGVEYSCVDAQPIPEPTT